MNSSRKNFTLPQFAETILTDANRAVFDQMVADGQIQEKEKEQDDYVREMLIYE